MLYSNITYHSILKGPARPRQDGRLRGRRLSTLQVTVLYLMQYKLHYYKLLEVTLISPPNNNPPPTPPLMNGLRWGVRL